MKIDVDQVAMPAAGESVGRSMRSTTPGLSFAERREAVWLLVKSGNWGFGPLRINGIEIRLQG